MRRINVTSRRVRAPAAALRRAIFRTESSTAPQRISATLIGRIMPGDERISAIYKIETPLPPRRAAEVIAGEPSPATFVAVPGESEELRNRFRARVENVIEIVACDSPSLPGSRVKVGRDATRYTRAEVHVSWPLENVGYNLPTL